MNRRKKVKPIFILVIFVIVVACIIGMINLFSNSKKEKEHHLTNEVVPVSIDYKNYEVIKEIVSEDIMWTSIYSGVNDFLLNDVSKLYELNKNKSDKNLVYDNNYETKKKLKISNSSMKNLLLKIKNQDNIDFKTQAISCEFKKVSEKHIEFIVKYTNDFELTGGICEIDGRIELVF